MDMAGLLGRLFRRQRTPELRCSAVVPAAGSSTRMEGQDKLLLPLEEQPVLLHTLRALELCPYLAEIIVVTREDRIVPIGQLCRDAGLSKVRKVIVGGATRTHSVLAGLGELSSGAELVAIHDGARPLVSQEVLETVILRAAECGAAAPAVPVKDTIKRARDGLVERHAGAFGALCRADTPGVSGGSDPGRPGQGPGGRGRPDRRLRSGGAAGHRRHP